MDNNAPPKEVKHRHRTPSVKQVKALQLMSQGYSKRRAMIEAGYSKSTADNKPHLVTRSKAAVQIMNTMKDALYNNPKLKGEYLAGKFVQWLEAQKDDKDDYKTQLKAMEIYKEIMEPQKETPGVKRKITYEEFLGIDNTNENDKSL